MAQQAYDFDPYYLQQDERSHINTLFVSGLPDDVKAREIHNLFRRRPGFDSCQLKYTGRGNQYTFGMSKSSSSMKFDIEKFDGTINFRLWQVQVKDVLIQLGLHKALKERISSKDFEKSGPSMSDGDWEELDLRAASVIRLCLAKNVLTNVQRISTAKEIWEKLEELYQARSISNRLMLKEQFHTFCMDESTKISDHLSTFNCIVFELESIGVKIDDEDKALRLIWSLPPSYEYMKPILLNVKEALDFEEVTSKIISEERRMKRESQNAINSVFVNRNETGWRKNLGKNVTCWKCRKVGHVKKNCLIGASLAKGSKSDAIFVPLVMGEYDVLSR